MVFGWSFLSTYKKYSVYLSQGETVPGIWVGKACETFGVVAGTSVQHQQFEALKSNHHVITGKQLTRRNNKYRQEEAFINGSLTTRLVNNRRAFFDFTVSAPKTLSVLFLVAGKNDVLCWHNRAVDRVVKEMEMLTFCVHKDEGHKRGECTSAFCGARYTHLINRSLEPNLHTHLTILNATPSVDGKNYAIESATWINRCRYFTAVYRDSLAAEAVKAGYELEIDQFGAPQIRQIADLNPLYSQRSADIAAMTENVEEVVGSNLTDSERKRLVLASRGLDVPEFQRVWERERPRLEIAFINDPKAPAARKRLLSAFESIVRSVSDDDPPALVDQQSLVDKWRSLLDPEELERLKKLTGTRPPFPPRSITVDVALDWSIKHYFERFSVAQDWQLATEALRHAQGSCLDLDLLRHKMQQRPDLLWRGAEVTTYQHYEHESQCVEWVDKGVNKGVRLTKIQSSVLTKHQQGAVNELLAAGHQFQALIGKSGSGKSESLAALINANLDAGYRVASMAPSTRSRDVLKHKDRSTLQLFLIDTRLQDRLRPGDLICLDEASFASFRQLRDLMNIAVQRKLRVVLCGDPYQHSSVEAGDSFRVLLDRTKIKREWLSDIMRQGKGRYRQIAKLLSVGKVTEAFALVDKAKRLHVSQGQKHYDDMAEAYLAERRAGKAVGCVQLSHKENDTLNDRIRVLLKENNILTGPEQTFSVHRSLGWTIAERQDMRNLKPGLLLELTQGKDKGSVFEIRQINADKNYCFAVNDQGLRMRFGSDSAERWAVCQRREIGICQGDTLIASAAMKTKKGENINGERFTVASCSAGSIVTDQGKVISTRNLSFAYSTTSVRSQGETLDSVIVGFSRSTSANKKMAYVAMTRARSELRVFAESKHDLIEVERRKSDRKSALELIKFCLNQAARKKASVKVEYAYNHKTQ